MPLGEMVLLDAELNCSHFSGHISFLLHDDFWLVLNKKGESFFKCLGQGKNSCIVSTIRPFHSTEYIIANRTFSLRAQVLKRKLTQLTGHNLTAIWLLTQYDQSISQVMNSQQYAPMILIHSTSHLAILLLSPLKSVVLFVMKNKTQARTMSQVIAFVTQPHLSFLFSLKF